ncbi:putative E3 ubiquitin-protein ligase RING2-B [Hypsibius exemplaris]|uniref:RING-type E3 ubiquitin transferase n=1 Tax=Hypsibius exemplaris TaxID=2072580 RepID=A0A1W0X529_HYPEX|nr:putative E3 ubiquitin-protein ligase RING2-B [Hypsibius exemplaris]
MEQSARLWNLTPYELSRAPHPIPLDDGRVVHTTGRLLESELQCNICLDILRNTRTTKECLHRFCFECIQKALEQSSRSEDRKCPVCRAKLVSMRALRADPLFDQIISAIFPNVHSLEDAGSVSDLADTIGSGSGGATGSRAESLHRPGPIRSLSHGHSTEPQLNLEIYPYTEKVQHCAYLLKNWSPRRRLVKVSSAAAASHVCKYILSRMIVENQSASIVNDTVLDVSGMELYIRPKKEEYHLLPNLRLSLKEIHSRHWNIARPMQIYFAFKPNFKLDLDAASSIA